MVLLDWKNGLRRAELADLLVRDVHGDAVIVRSGKGKKDRFVPLPSIVAARLREFIKDKNPDELVLGLKPARLGMKIKQFAVKAGLNNLHTHSLRHKFATDVLESGTIVKVLQALLGHENLNTTEVYLSLTDRDLYAAAKRLDEYNANVPIKNGQDEPNPEVHEVRAASVAGSGSPGDPWTAALRVAVEPANLCQALKSEGVEEVPLNRVSVIDKAAADHLRKMLQNRMRTDIE